MNQSDFVYLDVRWQEDGWHEAMRLRLLGWLPAHLAAIGIAKGVLETTQGTAGKPIAPTARGMALTEPGPRSFTHENCQHLAQVLSTYDEDFDWKCMQDQEAYQLEGTPLLIGYRQRLLALLRSDAAQGRRRLRLGAGQASRCDCSKQDR